MSTSLQEEREEQKRWKLLPDWANMKLFDQLVEFEFLPVEEYAERTAKSLRGIVKHAAGRVPYYARLFDRLGLRPDDVASTADLPRLPILTKRDVHEHFKELLVTNPTKAEQPAVATFSSGTTGQPTRVYHTMAAWQFFAFFKQRQYRWCRYDPAATMAAIRLPSQLPSNGKKEPIGVGETARLDRWRQVGVYFQTGPFLGYSVMNTVENQLDWLAENDASYLVSYPETLELLGMTVSGDGVPQGLRGLQAISEQLTPPMQAYIEKAFGVPVDQNYGLNEVGLVASRCREGGRYHWNVENYEVEIVDDDGHPVGPDEVGRIIVTVMNNHLMPLLRYDTDDLARTVEGPCPCGRTMPAFADVVGRYSRIAFLPEGTLPLVGVLRDAIAALADGPGRALRQFQVHQYRDDRFELRVVAVEPLGEGFLGPIRSAWMEAAGPDGPALAIVQVEAVERSAGGKYQDFTSDYFPDPDSNVTPSD